MIVLDWLPDNEARADIGMAAARCVANRLEFEVAPVGTAIEDALAYLAHACDRAGINPAETFRSGLRRYRAGLEDAPRARTTVPSDLINIKTEEECDTMETLTEDQHKFLADLIALHEEHGQVIVHENMREDEREMVGDLLLKGVLELRPLVKDQDINARPVVPTPRGRRLVEEAATAAV